MINKHQYTTDKWYVSKMQPYIYNKLDAGLVLSSKREFLWFDNESDYNNFLIDNQIILP
jgi:hypothetical protein